MATDIRHFSTETYNGWKNYETWNASLWIGNEETIYRQVIGLLNSKVTTWSAVSTCLIAQLGEKTPDGAFWADADDAEMNEFLAEMID